jgi:uncharacterized protein YbaR (Trm112 family)
MKCQALIDVLACPLCRSAVKRVDPGLQCTICRHEYPVVDGVPVMLPDERAREVAHERELDVKENYITMVQQVVDAFPPSHVVVDLGAGNRDTANPSIIRTDILLTPYVDLISDAHQLPFLDESVEMVQSSAVFEHLKQPFVAAKEIFRVLKPGGHVYAECAFVYPFHGYPGMYFNASIEGMRSLFQDFEEEIVAVAPWQMPSFSVETLLAEYLKYFKPQTAVEREFVDAVKALDRFPIRSFDVRFSQKDAARIAAGVTYVGMKPVAGGQAIVPQPILARWERDPVLRSRYPNPHALVSKLEDGVRVDNLLIWARGAASSDPAIAACFDESLRFSRKI